MIKGILQIRLDLSIHIKQLLHFFLTPTTFYYPKGLTILAIDIICPACSLCYILCYKFCLIFFSVRNTCNYLLVLLPIEFLLYKFLCSSFNGTEY